VERFERDRANLEQVAAKFGTTYERELASVVVMRARYEEQIQDLRKRKRRLKKSDFAGAPGGQPPQGLEDVIPPDLLPDENENA
jgi:ribosome-binding ATPase YchF (GTP1/OBG family)